MIENTFIHIQGIGRKTEQRLWEKGILTWQHFLYQRGKVFSQARDQIVREELAGSIAHRNNISFFRDRLSSAEMWRTYEDFRSNTVYLDIETSACDEGLDEITIIGLYDGRSVRTFINGINLDQFEMAIAEYDLAVTFNGTLFDLPYIRRLFPNISLPPGHIDLRFLMKRLGYRGGLKKIEKTLGIHRDEDIVGLNGYDAVLLWRAYQWGDESALDKLVRYNTADIVNLEPMMQFGYQEMKKRLLPRTE